LVTECNKEYVSIAFADIISNSLVVGNLRQVGRQTCDTMTCGLGSRFWLDYIMTMLVEFSHQCVSSE